MITEFWQSPTIFNQYSTEILNNRFYYRYYLFLSQMQYFNTLYTSAIFMTAHKASALKIRKSVYFLDLSMAVSMHAQ